MGGKSTHCISRDLAIDVIKSKVNLASDDELALILECFSKESECRNYSVETQEQVDRYKGSFKTIESISEFNNIDNY